MTRLPLEASITTYSLILLSEVPLAWRAFNIICLDVLFHFINRLSMSTVKTLRICIQLIQSVHLYFRVQEPLPQPQFIMNGPKGL
jgi:hypothetical protein